MLDGSSKSCVVKSIIWSVQGIFFRSAAVATFIRIWLFQACATCSGLPSYISIMRFPSLFKLFHFCLFMHLKAFLTFRLQCIMYKEIEKKIFDRPFTSLVKACCIFYISNMYCPILKNTHYIQVDNTSWKYRNSIGNQFFCIL